MPRPLGVEPLRRLRREVRDLGSTSALLVAFRGAGLPFGGQELRGTFDHLRGLGKRTRIATAPGVSVASDPVTEAFADRSEAIASKEEHEENRDDEKSRQSRRRTAGALHPLPSQLEPGNAEG
jgi:hypothetical protein